MPKSNNFRISNKGTLKNIMNPKPPAPESSQQGKMEQEIMSYLVKESKKDYLAEALPKKSLKSRSKKKLVAPPDPLPISTTKKQEPSKGVIKEEHITKILKYQTNKRFGTIINKELGFKYSRAQLTKYSIDNLETILHRIRTHLNTRNMDKVFEHMAKVTAKGYEDLVSGFGYDIEGFSELLLANPSFHDAFERWKIEKSNIPDVPPSFQLMYIVASTTYMAHIGNKKYSSAKKNMPVPKKLVEQKEKPPENLERFKSNFKPGDIII